MKTFKCKQCAHTADGTSPSVLIAHARDAHGMIQRGGPRRRVEAPPSDVDVETVLLTKCTDLFVHGGTDADADRRVLEYLAARFGPAAYEGALEEEEASAE